MPPASAFWSVNASGIEEVCAAVVWRGNADIENLRAHCRSRMPAILVPANFVTLEALPTNETGKVDRRRLREIATASASGIST
jgi:acyl-CoA synthetase (AMP-forming)/AMP-acid ligase II